MQTQLDEHELRLAGEGKAPEDPSVEAVVRKKRFLDMKKRGLLRPARDVSEHQVPFEFRQNFVKNAKFAKCSKISMKISNFLAIFWKKLKVESGAKVCIL